MTTNPFDQFDEPSEPVKQPRSREANYTPQQAQIALDNERRKALAAMAQYPVEAQREGWKAFYSRPGIQQLVASSMRAGVPATKTASGRSNARQQIQPGGIEALVASSNGVPVTTREEEIRDIARRNVEAMDKTSGRVLQRAFSRTMFPGAALMTDDQVDAHTAGLQGNFFGLPEILTAAGRRLTKPGRTFRDELAIANAERDVMAERSTGANIFGSLMGAVATGGPMSAGIASTGRLAASAAPRGAKWAGRALEASQRLEEGAGIAIKARNAGKIAATGAGMGALDATLRDRDTTTGAAAGGVTALGLVAGGKLAVFLGQRASDVIGATSLPGILKRFTSISKEDLVKKLAERRAAGIEPTLFELLPLADQQKYNDYVVNSSPAAQEAASPLIRQRAQNVGRQMTALTKNITGRARSDIVANMETDLSKSAGGRPLTGGEHRLVSNAARASLTMKKLADTEARNIMAPHDDTPMFDDVKELYPTTPQRTPEWVETKPDEPTGLLDAQGNPIMRPGEQVFHQAELQLIPALPRVTDAISAAAGILKKPEGPITGKQTTQILKRLRDNAWSAPNQMDRDVAEAAAMHVEDVMMQRHPQIAADVLRMRAAYAAKQRMNEGLIEGKKTRLYEPINSSTSDSADQRVLNAYDTPEGAAGRTLGQGNQLVYQFAESPETALALADELARTPNVQQAVTRNISPEVAQSLGTAGQMQVEGIRSLARAARDGDNNQSIDAADVARIVAGMNPNSMAVTKALAIGKLTNLTYIPEPKAKALVEMLFSQDPVTTNRAIALINTQGDNGNAFLAQLTAAIAGGKWGAETASSNLEGGSPPSKNHGNVEDLGITPEAQAASINPFDQFDEESPAEDAMSADADEVVDLTQGEVPYGRSVIEDLFPGVEVTDDTRDPNSPLGRKNPDSWHNHSDQAVDVRPIPGMTFDEFIAEIEAAGYTIIEAIDEVNHPSGHATGPHWHVVIA